MSQVNEIRMSGFIGTDPELMFSAKGTPWCKFRLAHARRKKEGDKWVNDGTWWFECKAFQKDAERIAELGKSCPIIVEEGHLELDEWQDKETGRKRTKPVIVIRRWALDTRATVTMDESFTERGNLRGITVGWKYSDRDRGSAPRNTVRSDTGPRQMFDDTEPF